MYQIVRRADHITYALKLTGFYYVSATMITDQVVTSKAKSRIIPSGVEQLVVMHAIKASNPKTKSQQDKTDNQYKEIFDVQRMGWRRFNQRIAGNDIPPYASPKAKQRKCYVNRRLRNPGLSSRLHHIYEYVLYLANTIHSTLIRQLLILPTCGRYELERTQLLKRDVLNWLLGWFNILFI